VSIHELLAIGHVLVRVITNKKAQELVEGFKGAQYGVTCVDGVGTMGPVQIVMTAIKRRDLKAVLEMIQSFDRKAFYSVEDLHSTAEGVFPLQRPRSVNPWSMLNGRKAGASGNLEKLVLRGESARATAAA
jgi:uncharacterized protein YebE (UPF0316 family)